MSISKKNNEADKNYLQLRKSNTHTKIKGNLIQLWLGRQAGSTLPTILKTFASAGLIALATAATTVYALDSDGDGIDDRDEMTFYPSLMGTVASIDPITDGTVISAGNASNLDMTIALSGDTFSNIKTETTGVVTGNVISTLVNTGDAGTTDSSYINKFSQPVEYLQVKIVDIDGADSTNTERAKIVAYYKGTVVTPSEVVVGTDLVEDPDHADFYMGLTTANENGLMDRGVIYKYTSPVDEAHGFHGATKATSGDWDTVHHYTGYLAIDTDGDGTPNHLDTDSDNDGILDSVD